MKTMKFFGVALVAAYVACTAEGAVCASFDAATIVSNGMKVADWMLAHPKRANHRDWSYGAFYAGLAEFARATGERRYIDAIREEGRTYGWKFEKRDADVGNTHCIGQAWLDIARAERDDAVVASVRAELDAFMAAHVDAPLARREGERVVLNRRRWYWCDALFMSPPVWAKLAAITGERKYLDFMMGEYRATYDHLYDREDHLFWRDARSHGQRGATVVHRAVQGDVREGADDPARGRGVVRQPPRREEPRRAGDERDRVFLLRARLGREQRRT